MDRSVHAGPSRPSRGPASEGEMAYLSTEYRDYITEVEGARNTVTAREERFQKLKAKEEEENRRVARERAAAAGDTHAQMVMKWHGCGDGADPRAALSRNILNGQSHRARMAAAIAHGEVCEGDEARHGREFGEERRLFLESKRTSGSNYKTTSGTETDDNGARRSVSATTPRSHRGLQSAPLPTNSSAGQEAPNRPIGHTRAPDPRASGTVRFGAGGRRTEIPPSRASAATQEAGAPRPSLGASSATSHPAASSSTARVTNAGPTPSNRDNVVASSSYTNTSCKAPTSSKPEQSQPASSQSRPEKNTLYQPADYVQRTMLQHKATWHAASPGTAACEDFLKSHPEAGAYLREARRRLINEITGIIKNENMKEAERYLQAHPERQKMLGCAMKAKEMVLYASEAEINAFYAGNQDQKNFFEAAKAVNLSKHSAQTNVPALASSTASTTASVTSQASQPAPKVAASKDATSTAAAPTSTGFKPILPVMDPTAAVSTQAAPVSVTGKKSRIQASSSTSSTFSTTPQVARPDSQARPSTNGTTTLPPLLRQSNGVSRPLNNGAMPSSDTANRTPAAPHVNGTTTSSSVAPARMSAASHVNGTARKAPASISAASSDASLRSAATDVTVPLHVRGVTNINFFDHTGNFLQQQQVKIEAPLNVTVMLNSISPTCDPREYFKALKHFAECQLVEPSHGTTGASPSDGARGLQGAFGFMGARGIDGAVQDGDGIWMEQNDSSSDQEL